MASDEKWYFTKEQLESTPSRQYGIDAQKELFYRQQAAYFIQDMGQRLRVSQLCINTASVYMHRFYVFHSFTHFPWSSIAAAALFLAAKVEEQPRKLEHVIRVHNICKNPRDVAFDVNSERYQQQSQDLVFNENVLLQTLGFDVAIDHPHAHVVRCCHLVRASKDLAQTSYFMASTSLHITTMCLQYKPTVVACFCIHLACKWSNWEIPLSNERREWYSYVDTTVTSELLQQLTEEFLAIFGRCPSRLKEKIMAVGDGANLNRNLGHPPSSSETDARTKAPPAESKDSHHRPHHHEKTDDHKHRQRIPHDAAASSTSSSSTSSSTSASSTSQQQREREYREKKERERLAHQHKLQHSTSSSNSGKVPAPHGGHHRPAIDPKLKPHTRPNPVVPPNTNNRPEHREVPTFASRDTDNKDPTQTLNREVRSDKERYVNTNPLSAKANCEMNTLAELFSSADKRVDPSRSRTDPKLLYKYRHVDEQTKHMKLDIDRKGQSSQNWLEYNKMNNAHLKQPTNANANSSKVKSPFALPEPTKSVPLKLTNTNISVKSEPNGTMTSGSHSNGSYNFALNEEIKLEKEQVSVKKPSMFSPEKTPPRKTNNVKNPYEIPQQQSLKTNVNIKTNHAYDARPINKKMDQVEGFENILRDSSMNALIKSEMPDLNVMKILQETQIPRDTKPDMLPSLNQSMATNSSALLNQPIVNGIETNPTLISNLLKEAPAVLHLPTISQTVPEQIFATDEPSDLDSHNKDKKKKNKEKHKHKDKSREEKEKRRKHKGKDKEKHKSKNREKAPDGDEALAQPIKITISKDKIQPEASATTSVGLKIKIPKEKIKSEIIEQPAAQTPIKIKISKDAISGSIDGKKREREKSSPGDAPPHKVSKYGRPGGDKPNGRNSFGKVGEDDAMSMLSNRYTDTSNKYINKGTSGT